MKAVKVRIYPSAVQQDAVAKSFGCARWVWNYSLNLIGNMVTNHSLAKSISDVGWGMFCTMLKYKSEQDGKVYQQVDRFFPSSHFCHVTLLPLEKMRLDVRSFQCPQCNQWHDRDVNAAINIRNEGLRLLALGTSASANGGSVIPNRGRRKSTLREAFPDEVGSPR